jgi:hypothetical protein
MKALTLLLAASIALAQKPQPAFTITISAGQAAVTVKSLVEIQVTLKNTSNHDLRLFIDKSDKAELSGDKVPRERVTNPDENFVIVTSGGSPTVAPGGTTIKSNPLKITVTE